MPVFFLYSCMEIIVGYGQLVVLAMFEYSGVLCVYLCICRYVNAMYVYLRVGASVCAYSTCTETCTLQYSLALQCLLIWCWKKPFPSLNVLLTFLSPMSLASRNCKIRVKHSSHWFSLTLLSITHNPIILIVQASSHTAPSNPSSALSWLHPATFSVEERKKGMPRHAYQSRNHVVRAFSSADRKAFWFLITRDIADLGPCLTQTGCLELRRSYV